MHKLINIQDVIVVIWVSFSFVFSLLWHACYHSFAWPHMCLSELAESWEISGHTGQLHFWMIHFNTEIQVFMHWLKNKLSFLNLNSEQHFRISCLFASPHYMFFTLSSYFSLHHTDYSGYFQVVKGLQSLVPVPLPPYWTTVWIIGGDIHQSPPV